VAILIEGYNNKEDANEYLAHLGTELGQKTLKLVNDNVILDVALFQVLAREYIQYSNIARTMQVVCCRNQNKEKILWCLSMLVIACLAASMVLRSTEYSNFVGISIQTYS
jgi:hypothetical protein